MTGADHGPPLPAGSAPASLLLIAPAAPELAAQYRIELPNCEIRALAPEAALAALSDDARRADLAIVHDALERLPRDRGAQLIARLRDLNAAHLLLDLRLDAATPDGQQWRVQDLYALGLRLRDRKREKDADLGLFEFSLRNYKTTPDWLNARFWANPELWGKHRW